MALKGTKIKILYFPQLFLAFQLLEPAGNPIQVEVFQMNSSKLPNFNTVKRECPLYNLFNFYATKSIVVGAFIFVAVHRG